jgi:hypothetical protein
LPYVFTEHGAIMAATILNSPRATEMSVFIVRAFVELREALTTHKELAKRLDELESRLSPKLAGHDQAIAGRLGSPAGTLSANGRSKKPFPGRGSGEGVHSFTHSAAIRTALDGSCSTRLLRISTTGGTDVLAKLACSARSLTCWSEWSSARARVLWMSATGSLDSRCNAAARLRIIALEVRA